MDRVRLGVVQLVQILVVVLIHSRGDVLRMEFAITRLLLLLLHPRDVLLDTLNVLLVGVVLLDQRLVAISILSHLGALTMANALRLRHLRHHPVVQVVIVCAVLVGAVLKAPTPVATPTPSQAVVPVTDTVIHQRRLHPRLHQDVPQDMACVLPVGAARVGQVLVATSTLDLAVVQSMECAPRLHHHLRALDALQVINCVLQGGVV
jgi:hypothetical protein